MRLFRIRNRVLQYIYRPVPRKSIFSAKSLAAMDALDKAIEEKITPLLSSLWK